MADNLNQTPEKVLVDMINRSNAATSLALTTSLVTFSGLTVEAEGTRNTSITVDPAVGSGYKGSQVVTYNRLDIQTDIANVAEADLRFPKGDAVNLSEFIPEIEAALGIAIPVGDVVDGPIPVFDGVLNEEKAAILTIAATSYLYLGTLDFTILGGGIDLADVILVTELDGLTYEAPVIP